MKISTKRIKNAALVAAIVLGVSAASCTADHGDFVFVRGGEFLMGSAFFDGDERPAHSVTVSPFHICRHEVTQEEWKATMGGNPSDFKGGRNPVETVSWRAAVEYCNRRSEAEGLSPCYSGSGDDITCDFSANGYRLPTEAEWEFAARGGNRSKGHEYSGSGETESVAWCHGNSGGATHGVMTKAANELGLYDMSGNVWEWCWDWYKSAYYLSSPANDPRGAPSGSRRVIRGGCWDSYAYNCRVAYRGSFSPGTANFSIGFRVVRTR